MLLFPLIDELVLRPLLDGGLVHFPWSSGLWCTYWPLSGRFSLHHQYYFPTFFNYPFWIFHNPGWDILDVGWFFLFLLSVWFVLIIIWVIWKLMSHSNNIQDLRILGIFGGLPPLVKEVILILQVHGPHLFCCKLIVPLQLTPTGLHVAL